MARAKACKSCGETFTPTRSIQPTCGKFDCNVVYGLMVMRENKAKREAKDHRERKAAAKPRSKWMAEAQASFNRWIRLRDAGRPCISCGTTNAKWDAGHYRSVGSNPALRFEPLNNHKQCAQCNQHKSGNVVEYRLGLLARIGPINVEWLEGSHPPKKYTIDDLRQIKAHYAKLAKEIEHDRSCY